MHMLFLTNCDIGQCIRRPTSQRSWCDVCYDRWRHLTWWRHVKHASWSIWRHTE